jgi:hypothetical protein
LHSEREGLRRQHKAALLRLRLARDEYQPAHETRIATSAEWLWDLASDDVIDERGEIEDLDALLDQHCPRGATTAEMRPHLQRMVEKVAETFSKVDQASQPFQRVGQRPKLEDLTFRGLEFPPEDEELFERVLRVINKERFPNPLELDTFGLVTLTPDWEMRRRDEQIREETQLKARVIAAEQETARLESELSQIGRPRGVRRAVAVCRIAGNKCRIAGNPTAGPTQPGGASGRVPLRLRSETVRARRPRPFRVVGRAPARESSHQGQPSRRQP